MSLYNDLTTVLTPYANKIKRNESDIGDIQDALEHLDVETDKTLNVDGKPADAKKTGDEISQIKADLGDKANLETESKTNLVSAINEASKSGLSDDAKAALLACFRHVSFLDDDDDYYGELKTALGYEPPHTYSLDAVFNPGDYVVYAGDTLDSLIPYLTVTYYEYSVGTVVSSEDYALSGTLSIGNNTITVSYNGLTATITVTAIDFYNVFTWIYDPDGESNMEISYTSMYDAVVTVSGTEHAYGVFTSKEPSNLDTSRRSLYVTRGKAPARIGTNADTSVAKEGFYPIPIPATAHKLTFTPTPSTIQTSIYVGRYIGTDPSNLYQYERINYVHNYVAGVQTVTWTPKSDLFVWFFIRKDSNNSKFTENPKVVINFE